MVEIFLPESLVMNGGRMQGVAQQMDSLPWPWPISASGPGAVVCLVPVATGVLPAAAQEIYRLAYERALAAARPSRYELATGASRN